jgi:hypothetical protein
VENLPLPLQPGAEAPGPLACLWTDHRIVREPSAAGDGARRETGRGPLPVTLRVAEPRPPKLNDKSGVPTQTHPLPRGHSPGRQG